MPATGSGALFKVGTFLGTRRATAAQEGQGRAARHHDNARDHHGHPQIVAGLGEVGGAGLVGLTAL